MTAQSKRPWPANRVYIARLYQARCRWCEWSSDVYGYPDRASAAEDKRAHVNEHRAGQR